MESGLHIFRRNGGCKEKKVSFILVHFKRAHGAARPGDVFWMDPPHADKIPEKVVFAMYRSDILPKFDPEIHENLLIIRSGGIGDLLALSDIGKSAADKGIKVTLLTQKKMFPVIQWWAAQPVVRHFDQPLFNVKRQTLPEFLKGWGTLRGEDVIEQGFRGNWYEVFSHSSGLEGKGRPQLRDLLGPRLEDRQEGILQVVLESNSMMRSMSWVVLQDITDRWPGAVIYGYEEKISLQDYLADLYDAELVISVDTAALHFREGIGKPALGIYSAFTAESRTKYYKYTRSIDIKSPCEFQPCFLHDNTGKCHKANVNDKVAPCLNPEFNPGVVDQVNEFLKELI